MVDRMMMSTRSIFHQPHAMQHLQSTGAVADYRTRALDRLVKMEMGWAAVACLNPRYSLVPSNRASVAPIGHAESLRNLSIAFRQILVPADSLRTMIIMIITEWCYIYN